MKREASDHPKLWDLVDRLPEPYANRVCAMGILEALWHFTAKYTPRGNVGARSDGALARWLGWPLDPEVLIEALLGSGWIDLHDGQRLIIHDWPEHADDALHRQLARAHQWFADGSVPKLTRLGEAERKRAASFYADHSPDDPPEDENSAPVVRPQCAPPRPAPPRQSHKKKKRTSADAPTVSANEVSLAWQKGIEAALQYSPIADRWLLTETFRRSLRALLREHAGTSTLTFACVVHGYRYARRGWVKLEDYFHPKTLLRPTNREEYLAAYFNAVRQGLEPPFLAEPASDSQTAQTRRVAQGIEEQIASVGSRGTPKTRSDDAKRTTAPTGDHPPAVRGVSVER
jgi:hypothetical protein